MHHIPNFEMTLSLSVAASLTTRLKGSCSCDMTMICSPFGDDLLQQDALPMGKKNKKNTAGERDDRFHFHAVFLNIHFKNESHTAVGFFIAEE